MEVVKISGRRLLLVLPLWPAATLALLLVTLVPLRILAQGWTRSHSADVGGIVLLESYLGLLLALLLLFGGPTGLRDRLGFRYTRRRDVALAVAAWMASLVIGILALLAIGSLLGKPQSNAIPLFRKSFDPLFVALVIPTVALLAPACEELLFRGAFFGWLRGRAPFWVAAGISAAVFAAVHLLPPLFPYLFIFGVMAALIRERTGSTFNTFVMHAIQNSLATIAAYVAISSGQV